MNKKRIVIVGGGITGLVAAHFLQDDCEVILLEKGEIGGMCRSKPYNGVDVDIYGGHIFNTKDREVMDFVFKILPPNKWFSHIRNASIYIEDKIIGFPFEHYMFELGNDFMETCLNEIGKAEPDTSNLYKYLLTRFGPTAFEKYFGPYNEKIWQTPLEEIGTNWINAGKVPCSDISKLRTINQAGGDNDHGMIHSNFYYPKSGGIQSLINGIKETLDKTMILDKGEEVKSIEKILGRLNVVGEDFYIRSDYVIYTGPLVGAAGEIKEWCGIPRPKLPQVYHGTDCIVAQCDFFLDNPNISWMYVPEKQYPFHRIANIAKFQELKSDIVLVECPGKTYYNQSLSIDKYPIKILDVFRHTRTYPIEPVRLHYLQRFQEEMKRHNVFCCGRWGRHQYMNMDLCIRDGMNIAKEVKQNNDK